MIDDDKVMQVAAVLLAAAPVFSLLTWVYSMIEISSVKKIDKSLQHIEMRLDTQEAQYEIMKRQKEIQAMFDEAVGKWEARNNAEKASAND